MNKKILIVDDHPILRRGLCEGLAQPPTLKVVGEATPGAQGLLLARAGILEDYRRKLTGGAGPTKPLLSERERQLLRLAADGRRNKEIAGELAISTKSVETYRSRLAKQPGYSSPSELVRYAIREGIAAL